MGRDDRRHLGHPAGTHPFEPVTEQSREDITEFQTSSQRVLIGRKLSGDEGAQATPVYFLKIDPGDRIGPTQISVKIKRKHATKDQEEVLEIDQVSGVVAGEDAVLDTNVFFCWRTLADERYYLDTGGIGQYRNRKSLRSHKMAFQLAWQKKSRSRRARPISRSPEAHMVDCPAGKGGEAVCE